MEKMSSQYTIYINDIDMQISKGCSIEFLSAWMIWLLIYKDDLRYTRLIRCSLQVAVLQTMTDYEGICYVDICS